MIRSVRKRRLPKMTCDDIRNTRTHAHNTLLTDVRARRAHTLKFAAPLVAALGRPDEES